MNNVISEYQKWKQQGEDLRVQAKQAMESRFRELLADYVPDVKTVNIPRPPPKVPACRDAMDVPMISTLGPVALTSFAVVAEEVPINSAQNLDLNKFDMSASGAMGSSHNPLLV